MTTNSPRRLLTIAAAAAIAASAVALPIAAAPAAATPICIEVPRGAWIELTCGKYSTKDQCDRAWANRGGTVQAPAGRYKSPTLELTCIGPGGGSTGTTAVAGTTDGLWHLSAIIG